MKKYLFIMMGAACLFLFTGCGKQLECFIEEGDDTKITTIISFKNNVAEDVRLKMQYKSEDKEELEQMKEMMDAQEEVEGVRELKSSIKGNVLTIEGTMDYEDSDFDSDENTYDAIKKEAEDSGYTCK